MPSKNFIYLYYGVLLVILTSWTSVTSSPPFPLRLAFLLAVIIPSLRRDDGFLPVVLSFFWALTSNGYSYSYMPTSEYLYVIVLILAILFRKTRTQRLSLKDMRLWYFFFFFVLIVNVILQQSIARISYTTLVVMLFPLFIVDDNKQVIDKFSDMFIILTIIISLYAILLKDNDTIMMYADTDRVSWVDPNYMGAQIGMGALVGIINILKFNRINLFRKILSPLAIVLAIPAVLLTGSRWAALCLFVGIIVLIFSTKGKFVYKLLAIVLLSLFVMYLYSDNYFELLSSRIEADDGTGAGRTLIWKTKLKAFYDSNPIHWIIGYGNKGGLALGYTRELGCHNDFVAFLCMYGIVGLVSFLALIISPLKRMNKKSSDRFEIIACSVYLFSAFLTLEPMESGVITFYVFLFYVYLKSKFSWY